MFNTAFAPLVSIVGDIITWLQDLSSKLANGFTNVINGITTGFTNLISDIGTGFTNVLNWFADFPTMLGDLLKLIYIPSEDFFSNQFDLIKSALQNKLSVDSFTGVMDSIKSASAGEMPNIEVTIMGHTATIINFDYFRNVKSTINSWIRGFMFVLLILYNYNMVYTIVRGGGIFSGTGHVKQMKSQM